MCSPQFEKSEDLPKPIEKERQIRKTPQEVDPPIPKYLGFRTRARCHVEVASSCGLKLLECLFDSVWLDLVMPSWTTYFFVGNLSPRCFTEKIWNMETMLFPHLQLSKKHLFYISPLLLVVNEVSASMPFTEDFNTLGTTSSEDLTNQHVSKSWESTNELLSCFELLPVSGWKKNLSISQQRKKSSSRLGRSTLSFLSGSSSFKGQEPKKRSKTRKKTNTVPILLLVTYVLIASDCLISTFEKCPYLIFLHPGRTLKNHIPVAWSWSILRCDHQGQVALALAQCGTLSTCDIVGENLPFNQCRAADPYAIPILVAFVSIKRGKKKNSLWYWEMLLRTADWPCHVKNGWNATSQPTPQTHGSNHCFSTNGLCPFLARRKTRLAGPGTIWEFAARPKRSEWSCKRILLMCFCLDCTGSLIFFWLLCVPLDESGSYDSKAKYVFSVRQIYDRSVINSKLYRLKNRINEISLYFYVLWISTKMS